LIYQRTPEEKGKEVQQEQPILSHSEGEDGCTARGGRGRSEGLVVTLPYPVHDVQLTAKSLDGTADLQQLEPQSVVYGQTGRYSVGKV